MKDLDAMDSMEKMLVQKAYQRQAPVNGSLELLPLCNMNCDMCYVRLSKAEMEQKGRLRTKEEWIRLAHQMKEAGTLFLLLTGGEPLLFPGFKEVYIELQKMGMILTINTNGTLINEEWADFFQKYKPRRMNITLYGADDQAYEQLCHYPGGFQKTVNAVRLLRDREIDVKINGSITSKNEELLKNLTVKDKIDGDLSNQIKILTNSVVDLYTPGEYPVKLQVSNSAGDTVSFQATIQVYDATDRSEIPFIHLKKYLVYTKKGDKLDAASYISKVCMGGDYDSDVPGDINKSKVKIKDEVDYDTPGSYEITYSVKSGKSRTGTVRLIVIVTE